MAQGTEVSKDQSKATPTVQLRDGIEAQLKSIVMYKYKDRIALHGVLSVEKELTFLKGEVISDLIEARFDALKKQMDNRLKAEATDYFRLLIAKGTNPAIANYMAFEGLDAEAATKKAKEHNLAV